MWSTLPPNSGLKISSINAEFIGYDAVPDYVAGKVNGPRDRFWVQPKDREAKQPIYQTGLTSNRTGLFLFLMWLENECLILNTDTDLYTSHES